MKTFTLLISALLLFIFIGEAQSQNKTQNNGIKKSKIDIPVTKKDAGFNPDGYCSASGGDCYEFIQRVQIGTIDNTTTCNSYADYTYLSTEIPGNYWAQITVTNGSLSYTTDECGIWVDWNQDEDFDDSGEAISVSGTPGVGPYTAIIAPEWPYIAQGDYRMRIRITDGLTPTPCGTDPYGEVEDYTIHIGPDAPNEWLGDNNDNWNDDYNWLFEHVPTYYEDVLITADGQYFPSIYGSDVECYNLTIDDGAELEIYNQKLTTNGDIFIFGQLTITNSSASLYCYGNIDWNNNSTADIHSDIFVEGHLFFNTGSDAQIEEGIVHLVGDQPCELKCKSPTSSLNSLYLGKTGGTPVTTSIASDANYPLVINGLLIIQTADNFFENSTDQDIVFRGPNFNAVNGGFDFSVGNNNSTFIFNGIDQNISFYYSSGKFSNIKFNPSSSVTIGAGDMEVAGDVIIESGITHSGQNNFLVGGDWINNAGPAAFDEGTGRVIFNGNAIQNCSTEEFNDLEINNPAGALYVNASNVTCAAYDWTAGTIDVFNGGVFTADSLIDNGISGKFVLSGTSSTINLTNTNGYVDLNGEIYINDGTMNVYGGTTLSYWPYAADAKITMIDGILDFHDQGIYLYPGTYDLTANISGGTVRTSRGFIGARSDFTPSGGTFEFYGYDDYNISESEGCTLYNVNINKSLKIGNDNTIGAPVIDIRSKKVLSDGGKSNTISLVSDFTVTNDLTITTGQLKLNGYELTVEYDLHNHGILTMVNSSDILNVGQLYSNALIFYPGSMGNLYDGTINLFGWIITQTGCSIFSSMNNTINFKGYGGGGFENHEASTSFGNIEITKNTGYTAYISSQNDQPVFINGHLTINNGSMNLNGNELSCAGNVGINNGGTMIIDANATLKLSDTSLLGVYDGGELRAIGTAGNRATITSITTGTTYHFDVLGTIAAQYANFENMYWDGLYIHPYAVVDPGFTFDNCTFISDAFSLLRIDNTQTFTCNNVEFINSGSTWYNALKSVDAGHVTFTNATGSFAGPYYEADSYDRIDWPDFVPGLWTGEASSDWFNNENWADKRVPVDTTNVTIPVGVPNYPVITGANVICTNITIEAGSSLEIGDANLFLINYIFIYGELIMHHANSTLNTLLIEWESGSSANIDNGKIYTQYWQFDNGTSAQLGTGNTSDISMSISNYDDDASFGNLVTDLNPKEKENGNGKGKSTFPIHITGDCFVTGGYWSPDIEYHIDGTLKVDNSTDLSFSGINGTSYCDSLILNGYLTIHANSNLQVHGPFVFDQYGELHIEGGSFVCDYSLPSDWIDLNGLVSITTGILEFTDANVNFAGTSSISGGTVQIGGSLASTSANSLKPAAGTVEMTGNGTGHYIRLTNGNYLSDLVVNRTAEIQIYDNTLLDIQNDFIVKSAITTDHNDIIVYGNVEINNGGYLEVGPGSSLQTDAGSSITVNNGGTLAALGTAGNEALITAWSGGYHLDINSGGTISAEYAIFEYMGTSQGVNVSNGAIIDPVNSFNNCTFRNGVASTSMSTYLTIDNTQTLTIHNASFPTAGLDYNVLKENTSGVVTFVDYSGAFSGAAYEYDPYNLIDWVEQGYNLDLTVFLEGPFNTTTNLMETNLNSLLPAAQPFNPALPYYGNPMPDWYYTGAENAPVPNGYIVDWVLVDLRDATSAANATPATSFKQMAAFVLNNGQVVGLDGSSSLSFSHSFTNDLFVVVWHRNHLGVLSNNPLIRTANTYSYNFSSGPGQAYGTSTQKLLGGGKWGMISGDGNGDGDITVDDLNDVWTPEAGTKGYLGADYNMDTQVENRDKNDNAVENLSSSSQIPE